MSLSSRQVLDIICDEEEFVKRTSPSASSARSELKFLSIPKLSFTAFRLSHTSPIELSLSSKVVLLGGVPRLWYRERSNRLWNATSHMSARRMQKRADRVLNHEYRNFYQRGKDELRTVLSGVKESRKAEALTSSTSEEDKKDGTPTHSLRKRSKTMWALPTKGMGEKMTNRSHPFRAMNHRKTVAVLPTTEDEDWSSESLSEEDRDDEARSMDHHASLRQTFSSSTTSLELGKLRSSYSDTESESHYTRYQEPKEDLGKQKVQSLSILEAYRSDTNQEGSVFDKSSTANATPFSLAESIPSPILKVHEKQGAKPKLRFQETEEIKSPQNLRKTGGRRVVRLKPTYNSKDAEELQILAAEPHAIEDPDKQVYKRHFKTERLTVRRIGHIGKKAQLKLGRSVLKVFEGESVSMGRFFNNLKCGKIVMMEKMLVMVKTAVDRKDPAPCFSQNEPFDTRVSERWKEYIVVARATGKGESSLLLQFYHHRKVPKSRNKRKSVQYGSSLDFRLNHSCQVGVYNTLDKTLYIQKPDSDLCVREKGDSSKDNRYDPLRIYILKCGTILSSGKWYKLLRKAAGQEQLFYNVKLQVPEAALSLDMKFGKDLVNKLLGIEGTEKQWLRICSLNRGYRVLQNPLLRYVTIATLEELKKAGLVKLIEKWERANVILGCDYKHYDMLRWCSGTRSDLLVETFHMFASHLLEYRAFVPPPREVKVHDGSTLLEPAPLEGFLVRLTDKYGSEKGNLRAFYFKPSYFFTNDNYLFFMPSYRSTPPLPMELTKLSSKELNQNKETLESLPQAYEQDPYPIDLSSHITWLNDRMSQDEFKSHDLYAFNGFNRRVLQILRAEGLIDLRNIEKIYQGSSDDYHGSEVKYRFLHLGRRAFWQIDGGKIGETAASILYLENQNGVALQLMAPNPEICNLWKTKLETLIRYWKSKEAADAEKIWHLKMQNLQRLKLTEEEESNIDESTPRWITNRGLTDTSIYNINPLCDLRPLLRKGVLYQKPKKHATFSKYVVVLVPGFLVLYKYFSRSTTGFAKDAIDHKHYLTIPISECYIYSGAATKFDLLNRSGKVEELNTQSRTLPRAYSDGWTSSEDESMRCFVLWFGKKRAMFNSTEKANIQRLEEQRTKGGKENLDKNPNPFKMVSRLGVSGKSMVFMARSRQEKNLWVLSILYELEKLKSNSVSQ